MPATHLRIRPGDLVRVRTERWRVSVVRTFHDATIVETVGIDAGNRGQCARFVFPFETIDSVPHIVRPRIVRPARWRRYARQTLAEALPSPTSLRTVAEADIAILPFQLEPALALTHGLGTRVLIADAVGLGKTIQASIIVAETLARARDGHALVLCPAGLRDQWSEELEERFRLRPSIIDSAALASRPVAAVESVNPWAAHPVAIASIDYVKRPEVLRGLEDMLWDVVVLDEAHALSGRSDRAAAASALAVRARTVVLLTATPHSGDNEAFSRMCQVGHLPGDAPLLVFRRTRRDAGLAEGRRVRWLWVRPTPAEHRMHLALRDYMEKVWRTDTAGPAALAMLVLARRAASSAHSLARSVERRLQLLLASGLNTTAQLSLPFTDAVADDDEPLAELAAPGLPDLSEECRQLERLLALARAATFTESKLRRLTRFLSIVREPAIVFTEYRDTLASISHALTGFDCVLLHGGMTATERRRAAQTFTHGHASVLLATDAASEGLNLHHRCRLVINLELPWTPLRLEQRVGRIDRLGQRRIVHAIHLVGRGSTEADLIQRLKARDERARLSLDAIAQVTSHELSRMVIHRDGCLPPLIVESRTDQAGITPRLHEQAAAEATRIERARSLRDPHTTDATTRPLVTFIRTRRGVHRGYWLWRIAIQDADSAWLWDQYIAVAAHTHRWRRLSAESLRRLLAADAAELDACRNVAANAAFERFTEMMRVPLATAVGREGAIAAAVAAQQHSVASALVQGGLFDRRLERQTTERRAVLEVAAARSARRADELVRSRLARIGEEHLVFAVIVG